MADELQFLDYEGLSAFKAGLNAVDIVTATTADGTAYTASIPKLTALKKGQIIVIIPDTTSVSTIPTLNLNGLGAKNIKQRLSVNTSLTVAAKNASWMVANKPVPLLFDGTQWVTITGRSSGNDLHGIIKMENGGTDADNAADARANLGAQAQHEAVPVALPASGWSGYMQTVSVSGVTADNTVVVGANPECSTAYSENAVVCTAQGNGTLTFDCESTPTVDLTANVIILD